MTSTQSYRRLLAAFVAGEVEEAHFRDRFVAMFKADTTSKPEEVFLVLDRLFADADALPRDDGTQSAQSDPLRRRAAEALDTLRELDA